LLTYRELGIPIDCWHTRIFLETLDLGRLDRMQEPLSHLNMYSNRLDLG